MISHQQSLAVEPSSAIHLSKNLSKVALLFPGQGAQAPQMLDGVKDRRAFRERIRVICDQTGIDVLHELENRNERLLNLNLFSSLITVLVSSLSLDAYKDGNGVQPTFVAGYSVGQWSAMYAAEMLSFEQLVVVLVERARLMDQCALREPSAMFAVIGVSEGALEAILEQLRQDNHRVFISNYNCIGQYSVAGTVGAIQLAEERVKELRPKKLLRLAVGGAWHCPVLAGAERKFADYLQNVELSAPAIPVVDNLTGDWLPKNPTHLRSNLALHLSNPVNWERGIKHLLANGCAEFVEIGFGSHLTKFGFFIDRERQWRTFYN